MEVMPQSMLSHRKKKVTSVLLVPELVPTMTRIWLAASARGNSILIVLVLEQAKRDRFTCREERHLFVQNVWPLQDSYS